MASCTGDETDRGQLRIPLKVGEYTISVHKPGFIDPPPESVDVKKAEEAAVEFRMDPAPSVATLRYQGCSSRHHDLHRQELRCHCWPPTATPPSRNVPPGDHAD